MERRYHVVAVNDRSGLATQCTLTAVDHDHACRLLNAFTVHPARHVRLVEASDWEGWPQIGPADACGLRARVNPRTTARV